MGYLRKSRYDYFLIWGHGQKYKDDIIDIIAAENGIQIIRIEDCIPKSIKKLVKAVYSYDYAPFHHLKAKTRYLLKTPNKVTFIFVKNWFAKEIYEGEGSFEHIESPKIVDIKRKIREEYNPMENGEITEDHVIHASDNESQVDYILNYLGYKEGVRLLKSKNPIIQAPYHLRKFNSVILKKVSVEDLWCNILVEKDGKVDTKLCPILETPHYSVLQGEEKVYENYINKFQGRELKDYYSVSKFKNLINELDYKESNDFILARRNGSYYQILDGVHRACILAHRGMDKITIAIAEE